MHYANLAQCNRQHIMSTLTEESCLIIGRLLHKYAKSALAGVSSSSPAHIMTTYMI
jgi:hypothetical protein